MKVECAKGRLTRSLSSKPIGLTDVLDLLLVTGFNRHLMTAFFVFGTLLMQILVPYHRYVFFLKWLTLSFLSYAAVLFTVHVPWGQVALRTVWPSFTPNSDAAAVVVGVFGTTISPYLFFWQASEEVEDMQTYRAPHRS